MAWKSADVLTYIYQAALLCEACGIMRRDDIRDGVIDGDLDSPDSDNAPQGPHANGGGEADCPQCCDHCGVFLENPLTADGKEYVVSRLSGTPPSDWSPELKTWYSFYREAISR